MASYAVLKSRGTQTEVTDANRQESRQKTENKGLKREIKGAREGPQVGLSCHQGIFFLRLLSQHSQLSSALQRVPC